MARRTLYGTTRVSRYRKSKTNLDLLYQDLVAVASAGPHADLHLAQTYNHTRIPPLIFTGQMPFLLPNQQRQRTEGKLSYDWTNWP